MFASTAQWILFIESRVKVGGWRILKGLRRFWVAYALRFCFVRIVCVPDHSAGQRVVNPLLRFDQLPTIAFRPNCAETMGWFQDGAVDRH